MNIARIAALLCLGVATANGAEPPANAEKPAPAATAPTTPAPVATPATAADTKSLSETAQPAANTSGAKPATGAAGKRAGADRIQLDTTVVTGNRELPKVLYIVPWKKADLGDLPAQPFNTLLDEVLAPVDRDVFRREVTYYGAIAAGADAPGGATAPAAGSTEK